MKLRITIVLLVLSVICNLYLFSDNQSLRWDLLYAETIPDIPITNNMLLGEGYGGAYFGIISGFVAFEDINNQPKQLNQYYTIESTSKFNSEGRQVFELTETYVSPHLEPRVFEPSELIAIKSDSDELILSQQDGVHSIKIEMGTTMLGGKIFMKPSKIKLMNSDLHEASLITSSADFANFIRSVQENR